MHGAAVWELLLGPSRRPERTCTAGQGPSPLWSFIQGHLSPPAGSEIPITTPQGYYTQWRGLGCDYEGGLEPLCLSPHTGALGAPPTWCRGPHDFLFLTS